MFVNQFTNALKNVYLDVCQYLENILTRHDR
nr:MAG TPA: Protein of unknown function (DUF3895) [Caudoviricetes sp.]